ncbi:MAG: hypothetical protein U0470_01410 [Anaerolineae bacterium]
MVRLSMGSIKWRLVLFVVTLGLIVLLIARAGRRSSCSCSACRSRTSSRRW